MILRRMFAFLVLTLAVSLNISPAEAQSRALISLHEAGQMTWEKRVILQERLKKHFGFDETRFLVDTTPEEVPAAVKTFLEEPTEENDQRLVWVSGLDKPDHRSICPDATFDPIKPRATSLILAPTCYSNAILIPQGARRFSLGSPETYKTTARIGRVQVSDAPWLAHLSLPADGVQFVQDVDTIISKYLSQGSSANLDPATLLNLLRGSFDQNGSNYTPSLTLFDRGIDPEDLHPFAFNVKHKPSWLNRHAQKIDVRLNELPFYDHASAKSGSAVILYKPDTVHVLRHGRNKDMQFVAVNARYFGWVRKNDLTF